VAAASLKCPETIKENNSAMSFQAIICFAISQK
jgi:hypothetical protein